jgi:hypothetical protein
MLSFERIRNQARKRAVKARGRAADPDGQQDEEDAAEEARRPSVMFYGDFSAARVRPKEQNTAQIQEDVIVVPPPVWRHPLFVSTFCDAYLKNTDVKGGSPRA